MNSQQIQKLRTDLGLSQPEFAQLFGAHSMTVSRWERGIAMPTPYQLALMQQFRLTADTKKAEVDETVKNLLVGAGVVAALIWLLGAKK
jgi:putative transcriptional regulator|nr:helix-turn-helix domain-containing protein [uncultured Rhodoferax sp.]